MAGSNAHPLAERTAKLRRSARAEAARRAAADAEAAVERLTREHDAAKARATELRQRLTKARAAVKETRKAADAAAADVETAPEPEAPRHVEVRPRVAAGSASTPA